MPETALKRFGEDVARARAIVEHANALSSAAPPEELLRSDLFRSAWMFAVGALDAYFSDAYTDVVAATVISKSRHSGMTLPDFFYEIKFPVRAILEPYANNVNWKWRMAAREMMERENVLSLDTIRKLFNRFFRKGHKFFDDCLDSWIVHPQAKKRMFGVTRSAYLGLAGSAKDGERKSA